MKKLLLIALLIPSFSFAQKFEVTEMGGYSSNLFAAFFDKNTGYSNQLSASYYLTKHISAGAYWEANGWNPATNTGGLLADIRLKHFYAGANVGMMFFDPIHLVHSVGMVNYINIPPTYSATDVTYSVRINPAISYGVHVGITQNLCKHLSIKEQAGYSYAQTKYTYDYGTIGVKVKCVSALAGIAYNF